MTTRTHSLKFSKNLEAIYEDQGRFYFTDDRSLLRVPEFLEAQVKSYKYFIEQGLSEAFEESFPIKDFSEEKVDIYFKELFLEKPKFEPLECKKKNLNYEAPFKVRLEMLNKQTWEIKEDTVFMGGVPLMTERGTFIINGIERVIIHQIIKSDGVYYEVDKTNLGHFSMKIKPRKGSWMEIGIDKKGVIHVKIDKKRKIPYTVLLRAFWAESSAEIIALFPENEDIISKYLAPTLEKDKTNTPLEAMHFLYKLLRPGDLGTDERVQDLFNTTFYKVQKFDLGPIARMKMNMKLNMKTEYTRDSGAFIHLEDLVISLKYLLNLMEGTPEYCVDDIDRLDNRRVKSVWEMVYEKVKIWLMRMERIAKDRMTIMDLDETTARNFINHRPIEAVLKEFFASSQMSQFMDQSNPLSELAHKRRVSALGPGGLTRERASFDVRDVHPTQYGRICPVATPEGPNIGLVLHFAIYARVNEYGFIMTPFREIKHYASNNGKDCVGRITLNEIYDKNTWELLLDNKILMTQEHAQMLQEKYPHDQIEVRAFLWNAYHYFDAHQEKVLTIAGANTEVDEYGNFTKTRVGARHQWEANLVYVREITHIDISPKQIMSDSTALIPFVESDDAVRAEMGTNMMRQAVPLIRPKAPIVGTGMERAVWEASGYVVKAQEDGEVIGVDAKHISVLYASWKKALYELTTFERSNHDLIVHQRPLVKRWDKIVKWQVLADGQSLENGELALGQNLRVAYMPWNGYNFEDAIIISSRVVERDAFTHVNISEYVIDVRETKLGAEQTTDDIPNVSPAKLKDLDSEGIIRIWAFVKGWDILVGKVTPKWEVELSPEERLLRAIFGDKSKDIKDSSLILPSGSGGKVIHVEILKKEEGDNLPTGAFKQIKVYVAQTRKLEVGDKMAGRHGNKGIVSVIVPEEDMPFMADGTPIDIILNPLGVISRMNIGQILETHLGAAAEKFGVNVATPILNGVSKETIKNLMKAAGIREDGRVQLFDWKTGDPFDEQTVVGIKYVMKLHHLVEDKIHARSVGPYSMVTQQPLGGKAQNGGQRFGEMEVWALEGYGVANILQEVLTIKSDDINGRTQAYEAIVKNQKIQQPHIPESLNVLLKELQALNLNIELLDEEEVSFREAIMHAKYDEIEAIEKNWRLAVKKEWEETELELKTEKKTRGKKENNTKIDEKIEVTPEKQE